MANGSLGRQLVACALLASISASGCTKTVIHQIAAYQPGQQPTTRPVREAAVYKVKVYDNNGSGKLHGIDGTERVLGPGDVVGFRTDDAGVVHATANDVAIPLALTPGRKVVWYAQYQRQTQFGREVEKALRTTGEVAVTAGAVALVGVAIGAGLALEDDESCDQPHHHRHHSKH